VPLPTTTNAVDADEAIENSAAAQPTAPAVALELGSNASAGNGANREPDYTAAQQQAARSAAIATQALEQEEAAALELAEDEEVVLQMTEKPSRAGRKRKSTVKPAAAASDC
jgi:hypothetical protein